MFNDISSSLIKADRFCDRIPVLSSINNLVDLVQKALIVPSKTSNSAQEKGYFSYLNKKSAGRCAILMIPVIGNLIIYLFDCVNKQSKKQAFTDPTSASEQVCSNGLALKLVSDELKNDKDIVLYMWLSAYKQVCSNGLALKFASDELKNDIYIVTAAVKQNGLALEFASDELKNNKEIVLAAVEQNALALEFASDELKNDEDIVPAAVKQNPNAFVYEQDGRIINIHPNFDGNAELEHLWSFIS